MDKNYVNKTKWFCTITFILIVLLGIYYIINRIFQPEKIDKARPVVIYKTTKALHVEQKNETGIKIQGKKKSPGLGLIKIKEKYQKIDEIVLFDGRIISGALLSKDKTYKMLTPGGTITIDSDRIMTHRIIR